MKRTTALLALLFSSIVCARPIGYVTVGTLTTATSTAWKDISASVGPLDKQARTFALIGKTSSGTGSVTYTVDCGFPAPDGSIVGTAISTSTTVSLSSSAFAIDLLTDQSACPYYRLTASAISGTGASVTLSVGY